MNEDQERKLDELHRYFMEEHLPGRKTRAHQIDDILAAVRAGKLGMRFVLWSLGFIAAAGAAWVQIKGWLPWNP